MNEKTLGSNYKLIGSKDYIVVITAISHSFTSKGHNTYITVQTKEFNKVKYCQEVFDAIFEEQS